jgi:hypothetical protein
MQRDLHLLATLTFALGASALSACSSSSSTSDSTAGTDGGARDATSGDGGGGGGNPDGASMTDGGSGGDGGGGGGGLSDSGEGGGDGGGVADGGAVGRGNGIVLISQQTITSGNMMFTSYSITASFTPPGAGGCTLNQVDACLIIQCPANASIPHLSAGDLHVMGGQLARPVEMTPDAMNEYMAVNGSTRAFNAGDLFHITASGSAMGVPAFDEMVTAPSDVTLTAPTFTSGEPLPIDRANPLMLTWTSGASPVGSLEVTLVAPTQAMTPTLVAQCRYPISAMSASIPASTLGMFAAGTGAIAIRADDPKSLTPGNFNVRLDVTNGIDDSNGTFASGQAQFQ